MYADFGRLLDPDVRYGNRKPQYNAEPDPYWRPAVHTSFMEPIGSQKPRMFCSRAKFSCSVLNEGDETVINSRDGRALHLPNAGAMIWAICSTDTDFWPNMTRGSFVIVFRASTASTSPPGSSIAAGNIHNNNGGDWIVQVGQIFSSAMSFGWYNNGTDSRILSISLTGLWAAGDLVTLGFSYSPKGSTAYVNGRQVGTTATAPATWNKSTDTNTKIAIGGDPSFPSSTSSSWRSDILSYTILDRELDAREWAWIHQNPLSWLYMPGTISNMISPAIVLPSSVNQAAVTIMA